MDLIYEIPTYNLTLYGVSVIGLRDASFQLRTLEINAARYWQTMRRAADLFVGC